MSTSGIVGSTISLAVGAGFAAKYRGTEDMAVSMFGDAALEEGEFWESLNFACLHGLRVLFVCEDNDLAIHTFGSHRRGFRSIAGAMRGFDCHVFEGDGTDVRAVLEIAQQAVDAMLKDPKPAFACFKWFRFLEHVGPNTDFHVGYRPKPSDEELKMLDPVFKYEQYLHSRGIDDSRMQRVRDDVEAQIRRSIEEAKSASFPGKSDLNTGVFA